MTVVVPLSGGKDSQACLKLAVERVGAAAVVGLFCDTGWEHPATYAHVEAQARFYNVRVETAVRDNADRRSTVPGVIEARGNFPNAKNRFCTKELKIYPARDFYKRLSEEIGAFEVWYGMRRAESSARNKKYQGWTADSLIPPHEMMPFDYPKLLAARGVFFRVPIVAWSTERVFEYLKGDPINPLYAAGFKRVGCFPCFASTDQEKSRCFTFDETGADRHKQGLELQKATGKSMWSPGCDKRLSIPCDICSM